MAMRKCPVCCERKRTTRTGVMMKHNRTTAVVGRRGRIGNREVLCTGTGMLPKPTMRLRVVGDA